MSSESESKSTPGANAVALWSEQVSRPTLRRLGGPSTLRRRFELDLAGFLNRLRRSELDQLAESLGVATDGSVGKLRARIWLEGAELEAGSREHLGTALQPAPIVLGERLHYQRNVRGQMAAESKWPRPIPPIATATAPRSEPRTLDELLTRAQALVGVQLGRRGRDKGQYGSRVAALLGVREDGKSEPDWRGLVEIKTVPVIRDGSGLWRIKEDPAIAMEHAAPHEKLARVLWIVRVADDQRSPLLSWYYQERDGFVAQLIERDLHTRPKGPKGARTKGWYLRKRFFLDSGLMASING